MAENAETVPFGVLKCLNGLLGYLRTKRVVLKWVVLAVLAEAFRWYLGQPFWQAAVSLLTIYLVTGGYKFASIFIRTFPRDARAFLVFAMLQLRLNRLLRNGTLVHDFFTGNVTKYPEKVAFRFENKKWTFNEVDRITNKIGNFFYQRGYRCGDTVAVFVRNSPEMIFIWLGLSKIGVISALINYSLKTEGFVHCVSIPKARAVIFSPTLAEVVVESASKLNPTTELFSLGPLSLSSGHSLPVIDLHEVLQSTSTLPTPVIAGRSSSDLLLYVYTSGTTGMPKGAKITHCRFMIMSLGISTAFNLTSEDVLYTTIPLYHTAGGVVGVGQVLLNGATMVVRERFSASLFWDEACRYNATCIQYIGELCRYVLNQPVRPSDKRHKVRVAVGNGLRPQIWREFQTRFNIKQIGEFYGATEGNGNTVNMFQVPGSVGFTTRIAPWAYPVALIRIHKETGEVCRGEDGLCMRCDPGEPGEIVGEIRMGHPVLDFRGYADESANETKIVKDVFRRGDLAYRSGDILVMDDDGNLFFCDRSGDNFRWKGENVSTPEVEAIISGIVNLSDVCVYGVEIPGTDGKAGMAAIADLSVDLEKLNERLQDELPSYARPVFVKLVESVTVTGTSKFKKTDLKRVGYDPGHEDNNRVYVMNPSTRKYQAVDGAVYQDILHCRLCF